MSIDRNAANRAVADDFRAHGGRAGGWVAGVDLLILHHVGARSGTRYASPLAWFRPLSGQGWAVVGTNGGARNHPGWVHNLLAAPDTVVEVPDGAGGVATVPVRARFAEGEEYKALAADLSAQNETARDLLIRVTWRVVPIVVFEPVQDR